MKQLLILISAWTAFSATALSHTNGGKPAIKTKKVWQLSDLSEMIDLNQLNDADLDLLQDKLDIVNSMPKNYNMVASNDEPGTIYNPYFCTGANAAGLIDGFQGFKCINLRTADYVTVTYSVGARTGMVGAEDYVGFSGGSSVFAGFMLHACQANSCETAGLYGSEEIKGVTASYAWWLLGGLAGWYVNGTNSVYLLGWQGGATAGLSTSPIYIN